MAHVNSRFVEKEFDYLKPKTLTEALDILADKSNVNILAGGTDLMVKLKAGVALDLDTMMDINGIEELCSYAIDSQKGAAIGTGVKLTALAKDPAIGADWPVLQEAILAMASISVRNLASIGGNICNASPGADTAGPFICHGATLELMSKRGGRILPVEDFFKGGTKTALEPDEMLTRIHLPLPEADTGAAFIKMSRIKADLAKLSITVVLRREGDRIGSLRMSVASLASTPLFLKEICADATGKRMTQALIDEIVAGVSATIRPRDGGNRTTGAYRRDVAPIITRDALKRAWERSGGEIQ